MSLRRNQSVTIPFAAIDSLNPPARKSGIVWLAGDCKVSIDGGAAADTTNLPTAIAGLSGYYSVVLTAAEMNGGMVLFAATKTGMQDVAAIIPTGQQPAGSVVASGGNTALTFLTDLTEATNSYWVDALFLFTSGTLAGQIKKVTAYNGATKAVTMSAAFTATPAGGDRFLLVNI